MSSLLSIVGIISGVVAVVVFAGTVVVYLNGSKDKGTIATLEKNNEALTERVSLLETNEARLTARVASLERENIALAAQRPSAEAIEALHDLVENQGALLARHDVQTLTLLRRVVPRD